jgi:hypothetical protein
MADKVNVSGEHNEYLEALSREELLELLEIQCKNLVAMDGVWFQSIERKFGMDEAMEHDKIANRNFERSEGRRLKQWLGLPEHPGLEGLQQALNYKYNHLSNTYESYFDGRGGLVFRVLDCRVQSARARKNMGFHPCKFAGIHEYESFAAQIDDRIRCACISCYPEQTDPTCACSWRFTIAE